MRIRQSLRELAPWRLALAAGVLGLALRLWVVLHSIGSNDALTWESFGEAILHGDLLDTYRVYKSFNHPPLMGYLGMLAYDAFRTTGVRFQIFFKLAPVAADVATAVALARAWASPARANAAVALFALSPCAVLASAYHCNTDSLAASLCLLAMLAWDRQRWLGAGLLLGAALNVKLIPAPLVLVLALQARSGRALGRYAAGLALAALPFMPVLLLVPRAFFRNAIAYNSLAGPWGLGGLLLAAQETPRFAAPAAHAFAFLRAGGRYLVLLAPVVLALLGRWRWWTAARLGALTLTLFLVLTPGFSVHYLVYPLPLLLAVSVGAGALHSTVAGAMALSAYLAFWTGTRPWFSSFSLTWPASTIWLGVVTWTSLVGITVALVRSSPERSA